MAIMAYAKNIYFTKESRGVWGGGEGDLRKMEERFYINLMLSNDVLLLFC
jgi:hypothetical protein